MFFKPLNAGKAPREVLGVQQVVIVLKCYKHSKHACINMNLSILVGRDYSVCAPSPLTTKNLPYSYL